MHAQLLMPQCLNAGSSPGMLLGLSPKIHLLKVVSYIPLRCGLIIHVRMCIATMNLKTYIV